MLISIGQYAMPSLRKMRTNRESAVFWGTIWPEEAFSRAEQQTLVNKRGSVHSLKRERNLAPHAFRAGLRHLAAGPIDTNDLHLTASKSYTIPCHCTDAALQ